jgi:H+/Cl- antiporter ClcA
LGDKRIVNETFQDSFLDNRYIKIEENETSKVYTLFFWLVVKTFMCWISVVPVPGGTVGYALALGAIFGRFYGEVLDEYLGVKHAAQFAIAGCAAVTVSVFQ